MTTPSPLDQDAQAILEKARAKRRENQAKQEQKARQQRAKRAWRRLACFSGNAIPVSWTDEQSCRHRAKLLLDLGKVLREDGWETELDRVERGPDPKQWAVLILRYAINGDTDTVVKMLLDMSGLGPRDTMQDIPFEELGFPTSFWLQEALMYEVLHIEPPAHVQPVETTERVAGLAEPGGQRSNGARPKQPIKQPSEDAITVYRYWFATGKTQTEMAKDPTLMEKLGRKVDQGTISRWLTNVNEWIEAGHVLPDPPQSLNSKPTAMDPKRIDLGANLEHRPKHQRNRRTSDRDE